MAEQKKPNKPAAKTQNGELGLSCERRVSMEYFLSKAYMIGCFPPKKTGSIERYSLREMSEL